MFLKPNFECFIKYDTFCSHSFDYARLRRLGHIVMKRFEIMENFYSSKTLLKMAGGDCIRSIPHFPPEFAPGCIITKKWPQILREMF